MKPQIHILDITKVVLAKPSHLKHRYLHKSYCPFSKGRRVGWGECNYLILFSSPHPNPLQQERELSHAVTHCFIMSESCVYIYASQAVRYANTAPPHRAKISRACNPFRAYVSSLERQIIAPCETGILIQFNQAHRSKLPCNLQRGIGTGIIDQNNLVRSNSLSQ